MVKESTNLKKYPKLKDSISYIYLEHAIIEQDAFSIVSITEQGKTPIPIAGTTCLLLGPGTTITHAAIRAIADCGCQVVWCGEHMRKFYAYGSGDTTSGKNVLHQAKLLSSEDTRLQVCKNMYFIRFPKMKSDNYTLRQLRGMEGVRMKQAYQTASKGYGVPWCGRDYKVEKMDESDGINRALTLAFDLLYSIVHAAIVSLGYSPALGFIHTGDARSFVYDIADLYKAEISIPAAFEAAAGAKRELDSAVRKNCRRRFKEKEFLARIAKDIATVLDIEVNEIKGVGIYDGDGIVPYGRNYGEV